MSGVMVHCKSSPPSAQFVSKGFAQRDYFRHRAVAIRKHYPDTFLLLEGRGWAQAQLAEGNFCQLNLYSDQLGGFPEELFTDPLINWHEQQLGVTGLIAAVGLWRKGDQLTVTVMQSDVCQQLFRHPGLKERCKTQLEKRFGHWYAFLANAVLDFAFDSGARFVYIPTSAWILCTTKKRPIPDLFERIYDWPERKYACRRVRQGPAEYWELSVSENFERIVRLETVEPPRLETAEKLICIFHDVEENVDTAVSAADCKHFLERMLRIEESRSVRATYNILGKLFHEKRPQILRSNSNHSVAFHSYDHKLEGLAQLERCREVDLKVKGYRPPNSRITTELSDYRLSYFNFEWLACSWPGQRRRKCFLENGIVKITIELDDYAIFTEQVSYLQWEAQLLQLVQAREFLAFGLHDCYGSVWLAHYDDLLAQLGALGRFVTADEMCNRVLWEQALKIPVPGSANLKQTENS